MSAPEASVPWREDVSRLRGRLQAWLEHVLPAGSAPRIGELSEPPGTGMSSETVLFELERGPGERRWEQFVLRLAPDPTRMPVFPTYDLDLQRRCLETVAAHTTVPVPAVSFAEPDGSWLGSPFLVMPRIDGHAPSDIPPYTMAGWLVEADSTQQRRLQDAAVAVLARLHTVSPSSTDLSFLGPVTRSADPLAEQLRSQQQYYEWAREGVAVPVIERALSWLEAHRPQGGPTVLNWGDARIGNILFRDFEPVAVLDWEMATVGPAEVDVAWMIWMHRFFQDLAVRYGSDGLPGFMEVADVVATYEACSARHLDDLDWFVVLAALRHAIITVRTTMRAVAYGQAPTPGHPDDLIAFSSVLYAMTDGL